MLTSSPRHRLRRRRLLSLTAALGVAALLAGCGGSSAATTEAAAEGQLTDLVLAGPATAANGLSTKPLGVIGYALDQPDAQGRSRSTDSTTASSRPSTTVRRPPRRSPPDRSSWPRSATPRLSSPGPRASRTAP